MEEGLRSVSAGRRLLLLRRYQAQEVRQVVAALRKRMMVTAQRSDSLRRWLGCSERLRGRGIMRHHGVCIGTARQRRSGGEGALRGTAPLRSHDIAPYAGISLDEWSGRSRVSADDECGATGCSHVCACCELVFFIPLPDASSGPCLPSAERYKVSGAVHLTARALLLRGAFMLCRGRSQVETRLQIVYLRR